MKKGLVDLILGVVCKYGPKAKNIDAVPQYESVEITYSPYQKLKDYELSQKITKILDNLKNRATGIELIPEIYGDEIPSETYFFGGVPHEKRNLAGIYTSEDLKGKLVLEYGTIQGKEWRGNKVQHNGYCLKIRSHKTQEELVKEFDIKGDTDSIDFTSVDHIDIYDSLFLRILHDGAKRIHHRGTTRLSNIYTEGGFVNIESAKRKYWTAEQASKWIVHKIELGLVDKGKILQELELRNK
nr:hypothetical protein [Candidatus Woesearchaeota archaeon]